MKPKAYAKAGVDIDLANKLVSGLGQEVCKTHGPEVLGSIGGFGGLFRPDFTSMEEPVLVSSIDGVGTKLKVAAMMERYDTIGEDLVNHCVNDILVLGAKPLFFLDYLGTTILEQAMFHDMLSGIARGCRKTGCALIGGETAQMPGVYHGNDFDLVGCIVGVVDRKKIITGERIARGDVIIGLKSSGLHTNGYSLARHVIFEQKKMDLDDRIAGMYQKVGPALLKTHKCYASVIHNLQEKVDIKGMAHITGGGLVDNIPRILPSDLDAAIHLGSWPVPPLFRFLASEAHMSDRELFQTFNMGIGMTLIIPEEDLPKAIEIEKCYPIGRIIKGKGSVRLKENL